VAVVIRRSGRGVNWPGSILDAADELAHRALHAGEHSQAPFAARMAQATDPLNEAGWRLEIETALKAGDTEAFTVSWMTCTPVSAARFEETAMGRFSWAAPRMRR
jgi:hypothetical protein